MSAKSTVILSLLIALILSLGDIVHAQDSIPIVTDLDWSSDDAYIAIGIGNGNSPPESLCVRDVVPLFDIHVYQTATQQMLSINRMSENAACSITSVDFSPIDNQLVVASGPLLERWNIDTQQKQSALFIFATYNDIEWNLDANSIFSSISVSIQITDETFLNEQSWYTPENRDVRFTDSTWSPDSSLIASGDRNGTIYVWQPSDRTLQLTFTEHQAAVRRLAWNPVYNVVASGDADGNLILWNPSTGAVLARWQAHQGSIHNLEWRPDGIQLVSTGADNRLRTWDYPSGAAQTIVWGQPVWGIAFSPDGSQLAYGGQIDDPSNVSINIVPAPPVTTGIGNR
jgi:WD40 repeat protein